MNNNDFLLQIFLDSSGNHCFSKKPNFVAFQKFFNFVEFPLFEYSVFHSRVYIPGRPGRAHPIPVDTIPIKLYSFDTIGPPESA